MADNRKLRQASAAPASAGACLNGVGFGGASPYTLPLLAILLIAGAAASAADMAVERTFDCDGAGDGALACSGCSSQFVRNSLCEACLAETLNVGPVCKRCQGGKAIGPLRSATCQPVCFYCLGCEEQSLVEMGSRGYRGVDTCQCDLSRLRRAFEKRNGRSSSNATAVADELWDGRHGIMMIDRDETRTGIIDGCRLEVSCLKRGGRHATTLLSSSCLTTPESRSLPPPPTAAATGAVAAAVLDGSSISSSERSTNNSNISTSNSINNIGNNIGNNGSNNGSNSNNKAAQVWSKPPSVKPTLGTNADGLTTDKPLAWLTKAQAQATVTVPPPVARSIQSSIGAVATAAGIYHEQARCCGVHFVLLSAALAALAARLR